MAPRHYSLGKRNVSLGQTRLSIVKAAEALFLETGSMSASTRVLSHRANVAPGTVLRYFPNKEALAEAVLTRVLDELRLPTPAIFEGQTNLADRLDALVRGLFLFYERSSRWYQIYEREQGRVAAIDAVESQFRSGLQGLVREALAPENRDHKTTSVVLALCDAAVYGVLLRQGLTLEEAIHSVAAMLADWLEKLR